jgi:steroid delta-isomerase-like uncharacterized protein
MAGERELIENYFRVVWMEGNWDRVHDFVASDYVNHGSLSGHPTTSIDDSRRLVAAMEAVFPDLKYDLPVVVASDGWAARHWRAKATHQGEFMNVPATGERVELQGMVFSRIVDGKIREEWRIVDNSGLLEQLVAAQSKRPPPAGPDPEGPPG